MQLIHAPHPIQEIRVQPDGTFVPWLISGLSQHQVENDYFLKAKIVDCGMPVNSTS